MKQMFEMANETATEEKNRLKGISRDALVRALKTTIKEVKSRNKDLPVKFLVQTRPFSTNAMSGRRKTYETKEYLSFRRLIALKAGGKYGINKTDKFRLIAEAAFSNKRGDLDNIFKPLLDSMVGSMDDDFDDCQVYEITARKRIVKKGQEYLNIILELIPDDEYNSWEWTE